MNRLKWKYPFCGYGEVFGFITGAVCMLLHMILVCIAELPFFKSLAVTILFAAASSVIFYFCINRLRPEEREKIAAAEPLQWRMLTMEEADALMESKQTSLPAKLMVLGFELVAGIIASGVFKFWFSIWMTIAVMAVTIVFHFKLKYEEHFWSAMDESAECARVPIDDNYNGYEHRRTGLFQVKYAVFYTPEGKFVVKLSDVMRFGNRLYIVRFRNRYEYFDFLR